MEIHQRFVCGTESLHNYLIELGYTLESTKGKGTSLVRVYKLENKEVVDTFNNVTLFSNNHSTKSRGEYRGYTISKELLTFFSQRQIIKVKKDETHL